MIFSSTKQGSEPKAVHTCDTLHRVEYTRQLKTKNSSGPVALGTYTRRSHFMGAEHTHVSEVACDVEPSS
jgi:hypothetical protein